MGLKNSEVIRNKIPDSNAYTKCRFREIFVVDGFEVENGVLGLNRDVYLSIVKFLNSSTVRKV
jgi:hypothetical protein